MNLLYIVNVWPEPQTSGASSRVLQLLKCFQTAGFNIVVASSANKTEKSAFLENQHIKTSMIELNSSSFDEFVKQCSPHIVIFDRFLSEEKFGWRVAKHCPDALRILDTIDLHTLRDARAQQCKNQTKDLNLQNATSLREIGAMFRCDLSLFVGDYELDIVKQHFNVPGNIIYYHPFFIAPPSDPNPLSYEKRQDFISIGSFLHPPNWDAVLQLKTVIWPQIRKQLPVAKLNIYGSYTPEKAKQLNNEKEGFLVKGFIENDFQAMKSARVQLAPLRFGAGIKSKCVLAFQANTPTITTPIGAEGLIVDKDWAGTICNSTADFINEAVLMYGSKERFTQAQQACVRIINHFNAQNWDENLLKKLQSLHNNLKKHREHNFVGQLLLHHQHLSTKYMSKWIEEKNQVRLSSNLF